MATKPRSPNYPACSLNRALDYARKVYAENHLHKAPRDVVARAMGYGTLNGGSLTAISALKKFGLLDEDAGGLKITHDALTVLAEPSSSAERARILVKLATKPELFAEMQADFPGAAPNDEILRSWLLRRGFLASTVDLPIRAYRETMELAEAQKTLFASPKMEEALGSSVEEVVVIEKVGQEPPLAAPVKMASTQDVPDAVTHALASTKVEREWLRGPLSKSSSYRLLVTGGMGAKEIGKLIKLLEAQKAVLEDDDDESDGDLQFALAK